MKTDKQLYKLFSSNPDYLFQSAGIRKQSKYTMKSVTFKELEKRTDGVLEPEDINAPVYIVEFQAQKDDTIYHRLIIEMSCYAMENQECKIKGILVFLYKGIDPMTKPWHYLSKSKDKYLRIVYLEDYIKQLEKRNPKHPLVIVFKPLFEKNNNIIRENASIWNKQIINSRLPEEVKE